MMKQAAALSEDAPTNQIPAPALHPADDLPIERTLVMTPTSGIRAVAAPAPSFAPRYESGASLSPAPLPSTHYYSAMPTPRQPSIVPIEDVAPPAAPSRLGRLLLGAFLGVMCSALATGGYMYFTKYRATHEAKAAETKPEVKAAAVEAKPASATKPMHAEAKPAAPEATPAPAEVKPTAVAAAPTQAEEVPAPKARKTARAARPAATPAAVVAKPAVKERPAPVVADARPAAPTSNGNGVDALLQQQLNGAIP